MNFPFVRFQGAIEGPMEFAEGVATGIKSLFGSAVGGAAGAFSKITGVLGKGLATLSFDEEFKASRARRRDEEFTAKTDIAIGGKNVVMVSLIDDFGTETVVHRENAFRFRVSSTASPESSRNRFRVQNKRAPSVSPKVWAKDLSVWSHDQLGALSTLRARRST